MAGVAVTFDVVSGNGTLTAPTTTTGQDGIARVGGWSLGIATGAQQIRATAGTLSTTISAVAAAPVGCAMTNYALGVTLALNWESSDCVNATFGNRHYDRLQFTTTTQQQIDAVVTGANGRALLLRNATTNHYVGLQPAAAFSPTTQNPMHMQYILAPGTYVFEPPARAGCDHDWRILLLDEHGNGRRLRHYITFASTNVTFTDQVKPTSCTSPFGGV